MEDDIQKGLELLKVARAFVAEQSISCAEAIYQTDRVGENSYGFIESICDIVGYDTSDD